jgi:uncharacterized membrane protein SpoIIM required for sporulation
MDLDAYAAANAAEWERLDRLSRGSLDGPTADELIEHYQAGAAQLSAIKTSVGESVQGDRLGLALSRARLRFTGTPGNPLRGLAAYFVLQLPAALYRVRWLTLAVAAVTAVVALVYGFWVGSDSHLLGAFGSHAARRQYAEHDFVSYYSENSTGGFFGEVWTHNAFLAAQALAGGITLLYVPVVIFQNAQGLGLDAAVMNEFGRLPDFFLYIAPHGQLELYSIFTACAAGLMIGWSWVAPGAQTRGRSLAAASRSLFTIVGGVVLSLLVSGVIEGFVTRQPWPWAVKIGIGTIAVAAFVVYQWVLGRRAVLAGETGDASEFDSGPRQLVAA